MAFLNDSERQFAEAVSELCYTNPFLPAWVDCERRALGERFVDRGPVWSSRADSSEERENLRRVSDGMEQLAAVLRRRLEADGTPGANDLQLYEDMVLFMLYNRFSDRLRDRILWTLEAKRRERRVNFYRDFAGEARHFLAVGGWESPSLQELPHIFALFFQIRRAFHFVFDYIVGASMPTARLRAAVWQSIFTHDMRRHRRSLHSRMGELTTLITGPSGTGKELVASAIGMARYVPFDESSLSFAEDFVGTFYPLNLSALSPTLIESELFGHRRGAFTGALADRAGWLELCPVLGAVFLDEIGDLDVGIQVKLLRVIETRRFQRLGDSEPRDFLGKIIAATNRDLPAEIATGRFREDLYYRLCADVVRTPSLAEQISDCPGEMVNLVRHICRTIAGEAEADSLTGEAMEVIERELGPGYAWPGNIRELAQCVRNVLVRREYRPVRATRPGAGPKEEMLRSFWGGELTADELLGRYITLVYRRSGSYEEAARRLDLDRRTVKSRVDRKLLTELERERD